MRVCRSSLVNLRSAIFKVASQVCQEQAVETSRFAYAPAPSKALGGFVTTDLTLFQSNADTLSAIAMKRGLPWIGAPFSATQGGLLGYGVNFAEMYRHAAIFVDRIIKGAKPSDIPIERATKFETVVNLKTAKALGLDIPSTVLAGADEVIE